MSDDPNRSLRIDLADSALSINRELSWATVRRARAAEAQRTSVRLSTSTCLIGQEAGTSMGIEQS